MHVYVLLYVSYCSSCHVSRQIALSCNFQVLCSRRHGLEVLPWIFWERLSRKPVIFRLVLCTCVAAWQNKMLQSQCACSFLPAENYVRRMSCLSLSILSWETPAAFNGTLRAWQSQCFRNIDIERSGGKTCFAWVRGCSVGHCKAGKQMEIALYAYDFFPPSHPDWTSMAYSLWQSKVGIICRKELDLDGDNLLANSRERAGWGRLSTANHVTPGILKPAKLWQWKSSWLSQCFGCLLEQVSVWRSPSRFCRMLRNLRKRRLKFWKKLGLLWQAWRKPQKNWRRQLLKLNQHARPIAVWMQNGKNSKQSLMRWIAWP